MMKINILRIGITALLTLTVLTVNAQRKKGDNADSTPKKIEFPKTQPADANVNKPYNGAILNVSPPGFCWWRAADYGKVNYKLFVYDANGKEFYVSEPTPDPVCVPEKIFPAGNYSWVIVAFDAKTGKEVATRDRMSFTIEDKAYALPRPDMKALLAKTPETHPKLLFLKEELPELKQKLKGENKELYDLIIEKANKGLGLDVLKDPEFHLLTDRKDFAQKRTDYRVEYHSFGNLYLDAVEPMAFAYMVTGEKKYGDEAKKHLLRLTQLPIGGALEIFDSKFDEITLQIADALPRAYDWAYDAFTIPERQKMEEWMVQLGDSLLLRMSGSKRDFYYYSGESHDGRIPPYMINFAMVLSHRPEAVAWLDFGITSCLTVYPQWGTEDGGWAEGVSYALTYSGRFIPPIEALYHNTKLDLWQRPFYKNFPYFLTYCLSPIGEISPFGDSEDGKVGGTQSALINTMLKFYAGRNNDRELMWWADLFKYNKEDVDRSMKGLIQDIMTDEHVKAEKPENIKQDRVFPGIGWGVMHSSITNPEKDLMYIFKSSPFGPESHSHLDQNSFAIMQGGKALAIPAGSRYPQHGSPFHTKYTRQTLAHNTILVNGKGQIDKDPNSNGSIFDSQFTEHIAYFAGEAQRAYGESVQRFDRHSVMLRPSVIIVFDEIELTQEGEIEWLLHGKEKFVLDQAKQTLISNREGETMKVEFVSPKQIGFAQDDQWPMDPKEGYPMVKTKNPENQWHFTGKVNGKVKKIRIAAVMTIGKEAKVTLSKTNDGATVNVAFANKDQAVVRLNTTQGDQLMDIDYSPSNGKKETMIIKTRK